MTKLTVQFTTREANIDNIYYSPCDHRASVTIRVDSQSELTNYEIRNVSELNIASGRSKFISEIITEELDDGAGTETLIVKMMNGEDKIEITGSNVTVTKVALPEYKMTF